ncbi:hypothetical protein [Solirubrum puertoriconensis]|uniref:Uncharacterized protein n=1 Tax=Solirubrum puertoriconensis TaxID=1751427 RepID=A0A9X0L676_SOLP1|nr:hypothetical protein [Solirubrum puertoriconensis]KUG09425.1 hypothetical protein ASU33_16995 [Solirubrum puertoriconensis]
MEELRAAAEAVRQQLNVSAFDEAAVQILAEFIEKQRQDIGDADKPNVVNALGCFLGECIIRAFGGQWIHNEAGVVGIQLGAHTFVRPFEHVDRQLTHGLAESVSGFYQSVPSRLSVQPARRLTWIPLPLPTTARRPLTR